MSNGHLSDGVENQASGPGLPSDGPGPAAIGCSRCGYDITGQRIGDPCPECGVIIRQFPLDERGGGGMAITAMVLGIVSIVGCMFYGILSIMAGPLAIWFSVKAKRAVREDRAPRSSQGMATAGFVCGIVGTAIGGLYLLVIILVLVFAMSGTFLPSPAGGGFSPPTP